MRQKHRRSFLQDDIDFRHSTTQIFEALGNSLQRGVLRCHQVIFDSGYQFQGRFQSGQIPRCGTRPAELTCEALKIGAIAKPDVVIFTADLPKTRSGKIMRRLLRDIAEGQTVGDTTTLADPSVVARLQVMYEEEE